MEDREGSSRVEDPVGSSGVGGREMEDREGSSRVTRMSSGVRENACTACDSPHCAGTWCECERAYRGMAEKKTEDLLFHSCLRGGRACCRQMMVK